MVSLPLRICVEPVGDAECIAIRDLVRHPRASVRVRVRVRVRACVFACACVTGVLPINHSSKTAHTHMLTIPQPGPRA